MEKAFVTLRLLLLTIPIGTSLLAAAEDTGKLETRYSVAIQTFEAETREELTRIARDQSLTGEEKIIRIEQWFGTQANHIAEINSMADILDRSNPLARPVPPARPVDPSPEGTAAASLHDLSRSLAKGEITPAEFDRARKPLLDRLSAVTSSRKTATVRLPAPHLQEGLAVSSPPEEVARALHSQNLYLASLSESEAAVIRANAESPVNRLLSILETRQQAGIATAPSNKSTNQPINDQ